MNLSWIALTPFVAYLRFFTFLSTYNKIKSNWVLLMLNRTHSHCSLPNERNHFKITAANGVTKSRKKPALTAIKQGVSKTKV